MAASQEGRGPAVLWCRGCSLPRGPYGRTVPFGQNLATLPSLLYVPRGQSGRSGSRWCRAGALPAKRQLWRPSSGRWWWRRPAPAWTMRSRRRKVARRRPRTGRSAGSWRRKGSGQGAGAAPGAPWPRWCGLPRDGPPGVAGPGAVTGQGRGAGQGERCATSTTSFDREIDVRWTLKSGVPTESSADELFVCSKLILAIGHNAAGKWCRLQKQTV